MVTITIGCGRSHTLKGEGLNQSFVSVELLLSVISSRFSGSKTKGGTVMIPLTREVITQKIIELYPELGEENAHLSVHYDEEKMAWDVHIVTPLGHHHHTYLDIFETQACLAKGQCVPLSFQVGEIRLEH
jgi:hypothetical protein